MNNWAIKVHEGTSHESVVDMIRGKDPKVVSAAADILWVTTLLYYQDIRKIPGVQAVFQTEPGMPIEEGLCVTIAGNVYGVQDVPPRGADDALAVQSACNLSGVIISMKRALDEINAIEFTPGTDWRNTHPILVLFAVQIAHLTHGEALMSTPDRYHHASEICRKSVEWHKVHLPKEHRKVDLVEAFKALKPGIRMEWKGADQNVYPGSKLTKRSWKSPGSDQRNQPNE